jgi:PAS domain S-box-containing protein
MRDEDKTREELLTELQRTRIQMAPMMEAETYRRRAERELDQVAQVAACIVKNSPSGLLILQRHSLDRLILINANSQAARVLEMDFEEASGAELEDIWAGATDQGLKHSLLNALSTGEIFETHDASFRGQAAERILGIRAFPMPEARVGVYVTPAPDHQILRQTPDTAGDNSTAPLEPVPDDGSRMVEDLSQDIEDRDEADKASVHKDDELSRKVADLAAQLSETHARVAQEIETRRAAEEMAATAWREMENRVRVRTEELIAANQSLELRIAESHAEEEALRAVRYELETRLRNQEHEIGELTEALEIEIEEHKKTEEGLVAARIELEKRMTEVDDELEFTNERLREQIVDRQRVEDELRASLAEWEGLVHELTARLSETTESLDRESAHREQIEQSISGEREPSVLMENPQLGVAVCSSQGTITALNPKLAEIIGTPSAQDVQGRNVLDFPFMVDTGVSEAIQECLSSGESSIQDCPYTDASGTHLCIRVHLAPIRGTSGEIAGCEAVFEDVSAFRVQEGHLVRSERFNALSRMAGGVADRFSETIQTFFSQIQAALTCVESADFSDIAPLLESMLNKCRDAGRTTRRLRQLARMRPRKEVRERHVFDLTDVVKETIEMDALWSRPDALDNGRDIILEPSLTPGCRVAAEEEDFVELMANLLENAVEAAPEGGKIVVETSLDGDEVVTRVYNEGAGIPRKHLTSIFEPFWTTKEGHEGLGLPVAFAIVRQYGGTMAVRSLEGQGATFTLRLPHGRDLTRDPAATVDEPARGKHRILLIFPLETVARMIRKKLTRLGYRIFSAQTLQEGMEVLKRNRIDAIVCDFADETAFWQDVSGTIQLVNMETGCPVPRIILLVESEDQLAESGNFAYANLDRIVEKPVSVARLVEIVAEETGDIASRYPEMRG